MIITVNAPLTTSVLFEEIPVVTWQKAKPAELSSSGPVEVWCIPLPSYSKYIPELFQTLYPEEKTRSSSFYREKDTQRFIIGRAMLRILLGSYLNIKPGALNFTTGLNKKPLLKVKGQQIIDFNVSHSGDYILIAIANQAIGIDIERYESNSEVRQTLQFIFSKAEISFIGKQASPIQTFYKLWTRKEALLKATSKGLNNDIKYVPCLNGKHLVSYAHLNSSDSWMVYNFNVDEQHTASIAYTGNSKQPLFKLYNGFE